MSATRHPQSVPLSRPGQIDGVHTGADRDARAHWQALVDARLIGNVQPLSPETLDTIAAWEEVLGVRKRGGIW
ncbi:hypothetical protein [Sphingomonas sp. BAUL-RG-20F-R05-02]|uniref:hypothetical protein n=1 Tax=Sphingomonas sp. BAUL-RG-20F-R05-02 TaxID=2914830 RepID=UPI001F56C1AD|nr:hypothetical protein [Sphingomonas sp. BAUL-RG-20F-R05-02]